MTAVGFKPAPLRNGALNHRLTPLSHTVHAMLPRCEHGGFFDTGLFGARPGEAPPILLQGSRTQDAPFTSRILSRKFSLVTRVSLMRLARFPWPRKDDTHRSVTAFFSRFPWPRKDDTHRSVTGCQAGYSSVGRASDCRACRDQMVPGLIDSGWPDLADAIRGSKADRCFAVYSALARAPCAIRAHNLLLTKRVLYQLS